MTDGIHVELAMSACDRCPVAALSSNTAVEELRVDAADDRVEFVADDPPEDPPTGLDLVDFGGQAHGRYEIACECTDIDGGRAADDAGADGERAVDDAGADGGRAADDAGADSERAADDAATDGGVVIDAANVGRPGDGETDADALDPSPPAESDAPCEGCSCGGLPTAFANFPVSPRRTGMVDGDIRVSFVLSGHGELQAIVDECEAAGLGVELRRLCVDRGGEEGDPCSDVVPVDLAGVTDRQAEIATVAAEEGYFEAGGVSADDVAAEFDLAKSTVSEHLRTVTAALFSQTFGDGS
ncbi:helix-turn-helix domain-containing protein [Halorubrum yunnanense]|uniref:Helix-turn-helix domain-containing protein n=1 Tax=Halorubrum yunnanense TaxID=1526162 RepID=A0ABD5YKE5_9EURY|nr:helix-turn-helix domain-containing protein [Halorubrum yunnanense]